MYFKLHKLIICLILFFSLTLYLGLTNSEKLEGDFYTFDEKYIRIDTTDGCEAKPEKTTDNSSTFNITGIAKCNWRTCRGYPNANSKGTNVSFKYYSYTFTGPPTTGGVLTLNNYFMLQNSIMADSRVTIKYGNDYSIITISSFPPGSGNIAITYFLDDLQASYEPPNINNIEVVDKQLQIFGNNFFNEQSMISITINGEEFSGQVQSINHTKIILNKEIIGPEKLEIRIVVSEIPNKNNYIKTFEPIISSVTQVKTIGGTITIDGGYLYAKSKNNITVKVGNYTCIPDDGIYGTKIECKMPPKEIPTTGIGLPVMVTITNGNNDFKSNSNITFSYLLPKIISASQDKDSEIFQIYGENLGSTKSMIYFGEKVLNSNPTFVSDDQTYLNAVLPDDACNGNMYIFQGDKSNEYPINLQPIISQTTKANTSGSAITITGYYLNLFNCDNVAHEISIKSIDSNRIFRCDQFQNENEGIGRSLTCFVPEGAGSNYSYQLSINNILSNIAIFDYYAPYIYSTHQEVDKIIIDGDNFGKPIKLHYFNQTTNITYTTDDGLEIISSKLLSFKIPLDLYNGDFSIEVDGQISNHKEMKFLPVIGSISSTNTSGGDVIITGYLFDRMKISNINFTKEDQIIECINPIVNGSISITCNVPPGYGSGYQITIELEDNQEEYRDNNPMGLLFSYLPPYTYQYKRNELADNSYELTIYGYNYFNKMEIKIESDNPKNNPVECINPIVDYQQTTCYLPKFPYDYEVPDENVNLTISVLVGNQEHRANIYVFDPSQLAPRPPENKLKIIIPSIVVPSFIALLCGIIVTIILIKRHRKMKKLRKLFNN